MKPSFKLALLAFSVLSIAPAVLAQSYSGTVGDLNTVFDPPMNINGTLCDNLSNNPQNPHDYKACSDGVNAARWMAEKYAKNTGKYLGCLDGFYQGMNDGYMAGANPTQEMTAQAAAYVKNANFDSASSRGLEKAKAEGQTESADQIIARYRAVVNLRDAQGRQVLPNKAYNYPAVTFNGFGDGYEFDILRQSGTEFDAVYATGWVTKDSKFEDRLAARRALALQKEYANTLCNQTDTIFGRRGMPAVSIWDFFRANRQVNFQNYGWRNPDWEWEIFDRDERTLEQYQTFNRLNSLTKMGEVPTKVTKQRYKLDANSQPIPVKDAAGLPIPGKFEMENYEETVMVAGVVPLTSTEVQALKNVYTQNFKIAYDRFYARQYASINYHTEGLDKYKVAKIIGNSIGQEVANYIARREAYNTQYQLQSAKKYAEEVKRLYKSSFDRLIGIFENNPVVELNEAEVVGQVQDSIFRPGEELKVQFAVTNLGEKAGNSTINFESTQDVQAATTGFVFSAPVLTRSNFVTNVLGRTSERLEARSAINIGMAIKNPGDLEEVARSLIARKQKTLTLNDYAEVDGVNGTLDFLAGSLSLVVNVKNPAKNVESPISLVEASIGNLGFIEKNVEPIGPGAVRQVVMNIESMDPLAVIIAGTVSGSVNVRLGNKIAHRQPISYNIGTDRSNAVAIYHDALATKRNNNTGREGKADRMAKLGGMLEELVKGDIERNVLWKKGEEVNGTIVALIQKTYDDSKRAGRIDKDAQAAYDELGKILARNAKNVRNGGGIRLAKPNKENFLKEIAKFAKISTKLKDWDAK